MRINSSEACAADLLDGVRDGLPLALPAVGINDEVPRVVSRADASRRAHDALVESVSGLIRREVAEAVVDGRLQRSGSRLRSPCGRGRSEQCRGCKGGGESGERGRAEADLRGEATHGDVSCQKFVSCGMFISTPI